VQAPDAHVDGQDTDDPHWPFDWHVWTALPEHWVAPGVHTPVQAPLTQEPAHAVGVLHVPSDWHDSRLLPEQVVWFGAHTPWQAPETHVWLLHAAAVPHAPVALHVCTPLFEHCFAPGAQVP
jgi:hypothetical protein